MASSVRLSPAAPGSCRRTGIWKQPIDAFIALGIPWKHNINHCVIDRARDTDTDTNTDTKTTQTI